MDIWKILGIQPTNDKKAIKRAYARKTREMHPEEHPEEFQELYQAYQIALAKDPFHVEDIQSQSKRKTIRPVEEKEELENKIPKNIRQTSDKDKLEEEIVFEFEDIIENKALPRIRLRITSLLSKPNNVKNDIVKWKEIVSSKDFQWEIHDMEFINYLISEILLFKLDKCCLKVLYDGFLLNTYTNNTLPSEYEELANTLHSQMFTMHSRGSRVVWFNVMTAIFSIIVSTNDNSLLWYKTSSLLVIGSLLLSISIYVFFILSIKKEYLSYPLVNTKNFAYDTLEARGMLYITVGINLACICHLIGKDVWIVFIVAVAIVYKWMSSMKQAYKEKDET